MVPFINNITGAVLSSVVNRVFISCLGCSSVVTGILLPELVAVVLVLLVVVVVVVDDVGAGLRASASSPSSCISRTISKPPSNLPFTYS